MNSIAISLEVDDKGSVVVKKFSDKTVSKVKQMSDKSIGHVQRLSAKFAKGLGGAVSKVGRGLMNLKTLAMGALAGWGVAKVLGEFATFESALVDMGKVTGESFDKIKKKIMKLPSSLGSATEMVKGYYQVISAGVKGAANQMETLITTSKLAKTAHADQAQVVAGLTSIMDAFGVSSGTAADLMQTMEKTGKTTVGALIPIIGELSSGSSALGLSLDEMGAGFAAVTLQSGGTEKAATQFKAIMISLMSPTKEMTELLSGYGGAQQAIKQIGFGGVMKLIADATGGNVEQTKKLMGSSEGLLGILSILSGNMQTYNQNLEEQKNKTGAVDKAWRDYQRTLNAIWDTFKNTIGKQVIEIGEKLAPAVKKATKAASGLLTKHREFITLKFEGWIKGALTGIANFVEGVAAMVESLYRLKAIVNEATSLLAAMGAVTTDVAAAFLLLDPINAFKAAIWGFRDTFPVLAELRDKFDKIGQEQANAGISAEAAAAKYAQYGASLRGIAGEIRGLSTEAAGADENMQKLGDDIDKVAKKESDAGGAIAATSKSLTNRSQALIAALQMSDTLQLQAIERNRQWAESTREVVAISAAEWDRYYRDLLIKQGTVRQGLSSGLDEIAAKHMSTFEIMKTGAISAARSMEEGFQTFFFDVMNFELKSLGDYITSFLRSISMALSQLLSSLFVSGIAGYYGAYSAQAQMPITHAAHGAVFGQSGLQRFAAGGIVDRPTQFAFAGGAGLMGEAGPEAIMPLTRTPGGDLGVKAVTTQTPAKARDVSGIAGYYGAYSAQAQMPITHAAHGAVFGQSGLQRFAAGGIVDRPTQFAFAGGAGLMGEAGPEAIMPLTRTPGGDLGVKAVTTQTPAKARDVSGIAGYYGAYSAQAQMPITHAAHGAVFGQSGLQRFAAGGIVDRPTQFAFAGGAGLMGEAGPEAIMPLTRTPGGDLGVKAVTTQTPAKARDVSGIAGYYGAYSAQAQMPITHAAHGAVFGQSGLQRFAAGGIVDRPTQFAFAGGAGLMGEAGPEAIMPLTRTPGGDLGVKAVTTQTPAKARDVSGIAGYYGAYSAQAQMPITHAAHGAVFGQSGLQRFAAGGIVDRPTQFAFAGGAGLMGEAGPEAIMPLTRTPGGDLGVKAVTTQTPAKARDVKIKLELINESGQSLKAEQRGETRTNAFGEAVQTVVLSKLNQGGPLRESILGLRA